MWYQEPAKQIHNDIQHQAEQRQQQLTKPPGSLGRLEEFAIKLAAQQGKLFPKADSVRVVVFAGDHGIAEENVSAFPQVVTREMVKNFANGGAAISVLARQLNASLEVIDVGVAHDPGSLPGVINQRIATGTANFARQAAMTDAQLQLALQCGQDAIVRAVSENTELLVCGEMGIANTTPATAIAAALLKCSASELAGPGTGLDEEGVKHKAQVIDTAIELHQQELTSPMRIMQYLGGFEIAALTGAYISAAQNGLAIMVDGFIATIAALVAIQVNPSIKDWMFFSHYSAEPGYKKIITALDVKPMLDFNMRLGEGSGAAVAVSILRQACALHNDMATFAEAEVSTGE
jgi:nicotinate-nucleotide--dimethylbenzimidazole phosphoribosyltransferase